MRFLKHEDKDNNGMWIRKKHYELLIKGKLIEILPIWKWLLK